MDIVKKVDSVETVAATAITTDTIIQGFTTLMGLHRFIQIKGEIDTHIREYSKTNFIANEDMIVSGTLPAANLIYGQSTPYVYDIATGTTALDLVELDFGSIAKRAIVMHITTATGSITTNAYGFYVYISNDGVNWTEIVSESTTGTGPIEFSGWKFATFRYLKVTGFDNDATYASKVNIYYIQALEDADDKCIGYGYVDSNSLYAEYEVKTYNEDIMLVVFTNNATYRIVDIDYLSVNYTGVAIG